MLSALMPSHACPKCVCICDLTVGVSGVGQCPHLCIIVHLFLSMCSASYMLLLAADFICVCCVLCVCLNIRMHVVCVAG